MKLILPSQLPIIQAGSLENKPPELSQSCWTAREILYSLHAAGLISPIVVSSGLFHICTTSDYRWLLNNDIK